MQLRRWDMGAANGNINLNFDYLFLTPGVYMLRLDADKKTQTIPILKN